MQFRFDGELRPTEAMKTDCGRAHFTTALGVDYERVTDPDDVR